MARTLAAVCVFAGGMACAGEDPPRCGDGRVQLTEECDDGNGDDTDGCMSWCRRAVCGDGLVLAGVEACDDGNRDDRDDCTRQCSIARCGDGFVQADVEACDDGNVDENDACRNDCTVARCGDGVLQAGLEGCDDGNTVDDDGCSNACIPRSCGDGVLQAPEQCDDGNLDDRDTCLTNCVQARCGDGHPQLGAEMCDDGNTIDDDGCSSRCELLPQCGDGAIQWPEQCDDGNGDNTDTCAFCYAARCGDGQLRRGVEDCDDGNGLDGDGCPSTCTIARCGDGFMRVGVEACDDGNSTDTDGCTTACERPRCGDGFVRTGVEGCDDQNLDNLDGCLVDCRSFDLCRNFEITDIDFPSACVTAVPSQLTLISTGFVRVNGMGPGVTFDGAPVSGVVLTGCTPVFGAYETIESCTTLRFDVPAGLTVGTYEIAVDNPLTTDCMDTVLFGVGGAPRIDNVTPRRVCEGPASFAIDGAGFLPTSQVSFDALSPDVTSYNSPTSLSASFADIRPGTYDVAVSNGPGCSDVLLNAVRVFANPFAYFVDPEVVYNGIEIQGTVYVSGINGMAVRNVSIRPSGTPSPFAPVTFSYDPARPNRVQIVLTVGLASGSYDLSIEDGEGCRTVLLGAFTVTSRLDATLIGVDPPFGWTGSTTPVTLTADVARGFQNGARAYLSPSSGGRATALGAVGFRSASEMTAVVPAGLVLGDYDLIIVNPDGSVGVLPDSFRVNAARPPVIDNVSPGSIPNSSTQTITLAGSGFDASVMVGLTCRDAGGAITTLMTIVTSRTATSVDTTVAPGLSAGTTCVVRATNADQSYGDFSVLAVTNPAENISNFTAEVSMTTARRAPAAASGRATRAARFIYVLGGDNGSGVLASVETSPLDRFGTPGAFRSVPLPLPASRTRMQALRVGRFIYAVGGSDGVAARADVWRAEVLDPNDAPVIVDILFEVQPGPGLMPGLWYYRVAAVMDPADLDNPNGETLGSDPQPVRVPALAAGGVRVTVVWNAVPLAAGYRVYRTPTPGLATGNEQLLAVVGAVTQFRDDGAATMAPTPRQLGDLGAWATMPSLMTGREGHGLAWGMDPTSPTRFYVFAIAGRNGAGAVLDSYERLTVDVVAGDSQEPVSWLLDGTNRLSRARWLLGGYSVDRNVTSRVGGNETWIYAGSGADASVGTLYSNVDGARVAAGGTLVWSAVDTMTPQRAGYGYAAAANQLFAFGGHNATPSTSNTSTQLCGAGYSCAGGPPDPPDLDGWNSTGVNLGTPRFQMGTALESGHIFVLGGETTGGVPTNTVESTVW